MDLVFHNTPPAAPFDLLLVPQDKSAFLTHQPDFDQLRQTAVQYRARYRSILIIGHGGNFTTLFGLYKALQSQAKLPMYFLNTVDPDYIAALRRHLPVQDTLVMSLSKSGENTTQLEATLQFLDYPLLFVTEAGSPLDAIAKKLKAPVIPHPPIGGRFTGLTEVCLLPLAIAGMDVEKIYDGGRWWHLRFGEETPAWNAASILWQLEQKGYGEVFLPFYSHYLYNMQALVLQLCHESFGKNGLGQTYSAYEGPEFQHHTSQRYLGGRGNVIGFFISLQKFQNDLRTGVPERLSDVKFRGHNLDDLDRIPLAQAMRFEMEGTLETAKIKGLPLAHLSLSEISENELGSLVGFWQLFAVYSALLRNVNPFDQPEVESGKNISFDKRLGLKGIL